MIAANPVMLTLHTRVPDTEVQVAKSQLAKEAFQAGVLYYNATSLAAFPPLLLSFAPSRAHLLLLPLSSKTMQEHRSYMKHIRLVRD